MFKWQSYNKNYICRILSFLILPNMIYLFRTSYIHYEILYATGNVLLICVIIARICEMHYYPRAYKRHSMNVLISLDRRNVNYEHLNQYSFYLPHFQSKRRFIPSGCFNTDLFCIWNNFPKCVEALSCIIMIYYWESLLSLFFIFFHNICCITAIGYHSHTYPEYSIQYNVLSFLLDIEHPLLQSA